MHHSAFVPWNKGMTPSGHLMKALEDAANSNANELGFGVSDLMKKGLTWMLYGLSIRLIQPLERSDLEVRTWPSGSKKMFVFRDFEIWQNSVKVGNVSSSWLIVDLKTRSAVFNDVFIQSLSHFESSPSTDRPETPKPHLEGVAYSKEVTIDTYMLDENNHLNNKYYIDFGLSELETGGLRLMNLDVQFKSEALLNEKLLVENVQQNDETFFHRITSMKDDRVVALLKSHWLNSQ